MSESMTHHILVFFEGRVQGVGFRYTTYQVAKGFELRGFVKNLPDGRVQLELEGDKKECHAFIEALEDEMVGYIRSKEISEMTREAEFSTFDIR